ncbi:MAG: hypothetical protein PVJ49_15625 [Acidobacteriota bacterium]|jgi:hypothetical protein
MRRWIAIGVLPIVAVACSPASEGAGAHGTWMRSLFANGRLVVGVVQNEEGIVMAKRHRLVLPGEE